MTHQLITWCLIKYGPKNSPVWEMSGRDSVREFSCFDKWFGEMDTSSSGCYSLGYDYRK